jgi:hypothetical protein
MVILADVSSSMLGDPVKQLRDKLTRLWPSMNGARLLAFSSDVIEVNSPSDLPEPGGGTALDLALERAAQLEPFEVVVISDGQPQDPDRCLEIARRLPGTVQTIFVGNEVRDHQAVLFMKRLASENGGRSLSKRLADPAFETNVRQLLKLPSPTNS